ncbi:MAG: stage III sporulation protein AD [Clostridia bacterium]|nr:stage III sporulation protein AD [Clostridia bacterium]
MAGGIVLSLCIIDMLEDVFGVFTKILEVTKIDASLFVILLKIVGIGYLTEFGSSICTDSGNSSIAIKIELAGKLSIFLLSVPIISKLIDLLVELIV